MCGWKAACAPCPPGRRRRRPPSSCARKAWPQPRGCSKPLRWGLCRNWRKTPPAARPTAWRCRSAGGCPSCRSTPPCRAWHWTCPRPWARRPMPSSPCAMNKWWRANPWCPLPPGPRRRRCAIRSPWTWAASGRPPTCAIWQAPSPGCCAARWAWACRPVNLRRWWPRAWPPTSGWAGWMWMRGSVCLPSPPAHPAVLQVGLLAVHAPAPPP